MKNTKLLMTKLLGHKGVDIKDGIFTIWGVPMHFFSYDSFSRMEHEFGEEFGDSYKEFIYAVGYLQAKNGTNILIKKFGIDLRGALTTFTEQSHMLGIGDITFVRVDPDKKVFLMKNNNPMAKSYLKLYGKQKECVDHYIRGILAGGVSAIYSCDMHCVERKCTARGDKECLFEIRKTDDFSKKDPQIKEQLFPKTELIKSLFQKEDLGDLLKNAK